MNSRDFQFCIRTQDGKKERYWKDEKKKILPLVMFYLDTSASRLAALACVEASWELSSSLRPWAPRTFNKKNNNNNNNTNDNNNYENDNNGLHEPLPLLPQAGPPPPESCWDLISNWNWIIDFYLLVKQPAMWWAALSNSCSPEGIRWAGPRSGPCNVRLGSEWTSGDYVFLFGLRHIQIHLSFGRIHILHTGVRVRVLFKT